MPTTQKIDLEIEGTEDGAVYFSDFRVFCAAVADCLRRTEQVVTGKTGRLRYRIADLRSGSAHLTLEPVRTERHRGRDKRPQVVSLFKRTVAAIQSRGRIDHRYSADDLQAFKKLAIPLTKHTKSLRVVGTEITADFITNVDFFLNDTIPSQGFVSGRLERINVHGRNEFVLFPPIDGFSITCRFEDSLLDTVRNALKRTVTVSGVLHFSPDSPYPRLAIVRTMEIHPIDSQLPSLSDLRGIGRGCTDGITAVEFVRSLRDD